VASSAHPREGDTQIGLSFRSYVRGGFSSVLDKKKTYFMGPWIHDARRKSLWKHVMDEPNVGRIEDLVSSKAVFDKAMVAINEEALRILGDGGCPMVNELADDQREAMEAIVKQRLSLLWGPPQTGTTSVLTKIIALFAKACWEICAKEKSRKTDQLRILYAMDDVSSSHQARDLLLDSVKKMRDDMRLPTSALGIGVMHNIKRKKNFGPDLRGLDVEKDKRAPAPEMGAPSERIRTKDGALRQPADFYSECVVSVVAGTIDKIVNPNYCDKKLFDIIIWENTSGTQSRDLYFVLSRLNPKGGRLVLAGNPVQSNDVSFVFEGRCIPVTGLVTPEDCLNYSTPRLITKPAFAYVFEKMKKMEHQDVLSVLRHNWCMNEELCSFLQKEIYRYPDVFPKVFEPGSDDLRTASLLLGDLPSPKTPLTTTVLSSAKSLAVVLFPWDRVPTFDDAHLEDETVLELFKSIRNATQMKKLTDMAFCSDKFMVATLRHSQRDSISANLERILKIPADVKPVSVSTESQKKNRDVCIVDMAVLNSKKVRDEPQRFLDIGNLSISLSRGRKKCIVLLSQHVLTAWKPASIVGNEEWARGLKILRDLVCYAKEHDSLFIVHPSAEK